MVTVHSPDKAREIVSPILSSCVGPAAWMVKSCGKQTKQKRKTGRRKRKGMEPEEKERDRMWSLPLTVNLVHPSNVN